MLLVRMLRKNCGMRTKDKVLDSIVFILIIIFILSISHTIYALRVTGTITVGAGSGPDEVAYDFMKGEIFVTNEGDNTVLVISENNNTVVCKSHRGNPT